MKASGRLLNFTAFGFPEFLLTTLGSDGRFPYWAKCVGFGFLLYAAGAIASYASNSLLPFSDANGGTSYSGDYSFIVVCVVLGCSMAFLLSTLRKLDKAIVQVNKRMGIISTPDDERKFTEFTSWTTKWMPAGESFLMKPVFWYYLETAGGAFLGALVATYWSMYSRAAFWGEIQFPISSAYFIFFCALLTYVLGASLFVSIGSVKAIRRFCKDFVGQEKILALNPDKVGGLRPIGQFSLHLDIVFAMPSFVIFSYLIQGVSIANPVVILLLLLYTIALVVVFFVPLAAAHDSMLEAKDRAYDQVNGIFKEVSSKISQGGKDFTLLQIKALKDVYFLYEKVSKMAVWPLNLDIVLKFAVTSSFPIIGSLIVAYVSSIFGLHPIGVT